MRTLEDRRLSWRTLRSDRWAVLEGGDIVYEFDGWLIRVFTASGTLNVLRVGAVEFWIVGGGGSGRGGGVTAPGGGGGGQVLGGVTFFDEGQIDVDVGSGADPGVELEPGGSSRLGAFVAIGGGSSSTTSSLRSGNGACGAGETAQSVSTEPGEGFVGGRGGEANHSATNNNNRGGGGGGGMGGDGQDGTTSTGGDGGPGIDLSPYVGTSIGDDGWFAGGGGGAGRTASGGAGGKGGGGNGGNNSNAPEFGMPNTGGGGGGGTNTLGAGEGGSGIVIVRTPL